MNDHHTPFGAAIDNTAEVADLVHEIIEGGRQARRTGAACPWLLSDRLRTMLHCTGWLYEDLRLALLKRDPSYRQSPITADQLTPR